MTIFASADDFNVRSTSGVGPAISADDFNVAGQSTTSPPTSLVLTPLNGAVNASWTPGASTVASYTVTATSGVLSRIYTIPGSDSSATLLQLTNSQTWTITLVASINGVLTTPLSGTATPLSTLTAPTGGTQPGPSVPDPPTLVSVTAADGAATVTWSLPTYTGGSAVTGFRITATDVAGVAPQVSLTVNSPGATFANITLTNGVTYSITVQAQNSTGYSANSGALNVTPLGGSGTVDPIPDTPPPAEPVIVEEPIFYAFPPGDYFVPSNWLKPRKVV